MKKEMWNGYAYDFNLIGIVSSSKESKLAWYLNKFLQIDLSKQKDIVLEYSKDTSIAISNYLYTSIYMRFELLQNRLSYSSEISNVFVLPEVSMYDYIIKFQDETHELTIENVIDSLKEIPIIELVINLDLDKLKSKENLLFI